MKKSRTHSSHADRSAERRQTRLAERDERRRNWGLRTQSQRVRLPSGAKLIEYTICDEPYDIPEFEALPEPLRLEIEPFFCQEFDDYSGWIAKLEDWIDRGAHVPQLYNRLMAGYGQSGRQAESDAMTRRTYERFPNYFFGKIGYAQQLIDDGRIEEARQVCGGSFALDEIARRKTLHSSEVRGWGLLMVKYLLSEHNHDQARETVEFVRSVSPDHPLTQGLEQMVDQDVLMSTIKLVEEIIANQDRLLSLDR